VFDPLKKDCFVPSIYILTLQLPDFFAVKLKLRFSLLVACYSPFPAILLQLGNWLGFSQEGSHWCIYALISPFGGNGSDFSASPALHWRKPVG